METMTSEDQFSDLAPFYDPIMEPIDYDRWLVVANQVAESLVSAKNPKHIDVACGTCALTKRFVQQGWDSIGLDRSPPMLHSAKKDSYCPPVVACDMRAIPFRESFDYATCLFDSLNFLLDDGDLARAFQEVYDALRPGGIFYFDIITQRMVTEHFEGKKWTERNGTFLTTWEGEFDRRTGIAETSVQVNRGVKHYLRERVYTREDVEEAANSVGFNLLGAFDAETWKAPRRKSIRIDFVAVKGGDVDRLVKKMKPLQKTVKAMLD